MDEDKDEIYIELDKGHDKPLYEHLRKDKNEQERNQSK